MKYIKTYENKEEYKVGDWVFLTNWWAGQHLRDFINNTPCEIINIITHTDMIMSVDI